MGHTQCDTVILLLNKLFSLHTLNTTGPQPEQAAPLHTSPNPSCSMPSNALPNCFRSWGSTAHLQFCICVAQFGLCYLTVTAFSRPSSQPQRAPPCPKRRALRRRITRSSQRARSHGHGHDGCCSLSELVRKASQRRTRTTLVRHSDHARLRGCRGQGWPCVERIIISGDVHH